MFLFKKKINLGPLGAIWRLALKIRLCQKEALIKTLNGAKFEIHRYSGGSRLSPHPV